MQWYTLQLIIVKEESAWDQLWKNWFLFGFSILATASQWESSTKTGQGQVKGRPCWQITSRATLPHGRTASSGEKVQSGDPEILCPVLVWMDTMLAQMIQTATVTSEEDNVLLSSICKKISKLSFDNIDPDHVFDLWDWGWTGPGSRVTCTVAVGKLMFWNNREIWLHFWTFTSDYCKD